MRVAVLDDWLDIARTAAPWEQIAGLEELTIFTDHEPTPDRLLDRLQAYDVVSIMRERTPFPADVIRGLPNLRLLVTSGMRNASIDLEVASRQGVVVCGTDGSGAATAELAWGLVLATARDLPGQDRSVREGAWQSNIGRSLAGNRLGLIGLGRQGEMVAGYGQAFGMDVVAWSENLTEERAHEVGVQPVSKETLLRTSDVVSVHMRLSERTRGLLGRTELSLMKPAALLINTSRGPIVDDAALVHALEHGHIGGAGLDVFAIEPLPSGHPFTKLRNVVLSPHQGYATRETFIMYYRQMVEDIAAFAAGSPIRTLI